MKILPDPYGSAPRNAGRYVLYLSRHGDDDTQTMVLVFGAPYSARKFLDVLLEKDGYIWEDDCTIRSETGIVVSTRWYPKRMRACVEHEYSVAEFAWDLDPLHVGYARRFRYGPEQPRELTPEQQERRPRQRQAPSGPRASRDGLVPIADVALQLNVTPRECRAALRKLKVPKPAAGWAFPAAEVDAIRERIRSAL